MTDGQDNTPDWIKKEIRLKADQKRRLAEQQQHELEKAQSVPEGIPAFWHGLVTQLKNNTDHLKDIEGEHLVGITSTSTDDEWQCHVEVNRQSVNPPPYPSHMNLFYQPGADLIRRTYLNQTMPPIRFGPGQRGMIAQIDECAGPLMPEQLGDFIVKWMVQQIWGSATTGSSHPEATSDARDTT